MLLSLSWFASMRRGRLFLRRWGGFALFIAVSGLGGPVADAQGDVPATVRVLQSETNFRLRAQAVLALGAGRDQSMVPYVERALLDPHPAVRSSAAAALLRLEAVSSLPTLRRVADRERSPLVGSDFSDAISGLEEAQERATRVDLGGESSVVGDSIPWRRVRRLYFLAPVESAAALQSEAINEAAMSKLVDELTEHRRSAVLSSETPLGRRASRHIRRRNLDPLQVQLRITQLRAFRAARTVRVQAEVSIIIMQEDGGAVRSVLSGRGQSEATRSQNEPRQRLELAESAAAAAVESAMRGASAALASAR